MPTPSRASPDALLALAEREGRGHLKVFFGAAPGVGKTYAMLQAARAARVAGRDVVAGLVETHGRAETEALLDGLEVLPRRLIAHRGRAVPEFDLDAALARRPGLLLVDEYAHTNVPGSRHPKRWQDVEELLGAGIDVWTTLNVQHLESVNDLVQKITKVRVRETVPDRAFEGADELVLVDLPPEDLLARLGEGKVYVQDTATRAAENFFKVQNLTALRELALRRVAARVDDSLVERLQAGAIEGAYAAGERILACVGPDPLSPEVVRTAKRLADLLSAPWTVVTVERPGERGEEARRRRLDETFALASGLGAETETLIGSDIPGEVLAHARRENATQIVIGRARTRFLTELMGRSLPHQLVRRAEDIAVHVIAGSPEPAPEPARSGRRLGAGAFMAYLWSGLAVALAVLVGAGLEAVTTLPNLSMVFLAAVLFAAIRFGMWPAIAASLLSFLAYNFFFIPPIYSFTVANPSELFALAVFLLVAVATSALAGRVRDQAHAAADRVKATRRLYEFTRRLSELATPDGVADGAAGAVHAALGRTTVILLDQLDEAGAKALSLAAVWPPGEDLDAAAMAAARWAYEHGEPAGADTGTLPTVPWLFLPLRTARGAVGAIGVTEPADGVPLDPEPRALLDALAEGTAAAVERARLAQDMGRVQGEAETERVRNTLLASISHDFRTPLAAILGAATSLIDYGGRLDEAARRDLLGQVREEAEGLDRMVRDLLAMTRIEAGALELRRDWVDLREVADRVAEGARRHGAAGRLDVALPAELPLVRADARLLEQALANVVRNALEHTPPGTPALVDAAVEPSAVRLRVTDRGPGIPAELLPRVFDKFVRAEGPRADRGEGTGLGLAIVKGIVERHGGRVEVESPVVGSPGTRVTLVLPREGERA